jgi:hypothetical protein
VLNKSDRLRRDSILCTESRNNDVNYNINSGRSSKLLL